MWGLLSGEPESPTAPLTGLELQSGFISSSVTSVTSRGAFVPAQLETPASRLRVIPRFYALSDVRKDERLWRVWTFPLLFSSPGGGPMKGGGGGRVVSSVWQGAAAAAQSGKMARRCSRATSQQTPVRRPTAAAILMCFCLLPSAAQAGLYTASDQITLLTRDNVESVLVNSTAAAVVEFYASWCGHCISFSPVYKSLARDISG